MFTMRHPTDKVSLLAGVFLILASLAAPAAGGLPCDLLLPPGTEVTDYFDDSGVLPLKVDDECGMIVSADPTLERDGWNGVAFPLQPFPYEVKLRVLLRVGGVDLPVGEALPVVLATKEGAFWGPTPVVAISLVQRPRGIVAVLTVNDDLRSYRLPVGRVDPNGELMEIRMTRSTGKGLMDGQVAVKIGQGEEPARAISGLELWDSLPNLLEIGAFPADGARVTGNLTFLPLEFGQQYFPLTAVR